MVLTTSAAMTAPTAPDHPPSRRLRYAEAAAYLGIPVGTLRNMVAREEIEHIRLGPRTVVFDLDSLNAHLAQHRRPAASGAR